MQIFRQSIPGRESIRCKDPEGTTLRTRDTEKLPISKLREKLAKIQQTSF